MAQPFALRSEPDSARPLLDVAKSDLESFARKHKIPFRQDASNLRPDIQRNRIRRELFPLLRRYYQPALNRVVLRLMDIAGAESEFVAEARGRWLKLEHASAQPRAGSFN